MLQVKVPPFQKWQALVELFGKIKSNSNFSYLFKNSFLVGGTALAIQVKHRFSYDLDFMWIATEKLPHRKLIPVIENSLRKIGVPFKRFHNKKIDIELLNAGLLPEEHYLLYQTKILGEDIKIEIWVSDNPQHKEILLQQKQNPKWGLINLASPESIFVLKTLTEKLARKLCFLKRG